MDWNTSNTNFDANGLGSSFGARDGLPPNLSSTAVGKEHPSACAYNSVNRKSHLKKSKKNSRQHHRPFVADRTDGASPYLEHFPALASEKETGEADMAELVIEEDGIVEAAPLSSTPTDKATDFAEPHAADDIFKSLDRRA